MSPVVAYATVLMGRVPHGRPGEAGPVGPGEVLHALRKDADPRGRYGRAWFRRSVKDV